MPKVIGIIPARLESTRLPGKLLLAETGKPLIVHTIEQALKASLLDEVVVATDARLLADVCQEYAPVFLTSHNHKNGTSRCAELVRGLDDIYVNIQGDEPEIDPKLIDRIVLNLANSGSSVATAVTPEIGIGQNTNKVKAILNGHCSAVHFQRRQDETVSYPLHRHIGVYAFRGSVLADYPEMVPSAYERTENLEQLRFLWNGYSISAVITESAHPGIDTREQYDAFVARVTSTAQPLI